MHLPIGYSNFGKIMQNRLDFVDKSLFIKEVLDDRSTEVIVITRPRRFGKTLNLSMLHHFLVSEAYHMQTKGLFDQLKIANAGDEYMQHQGKYPVIFVSLKDVKDHQFSAAYDSLCELIRSIYNEHHYLLSSDKLQVSEKKIYESILNSQATEAHIKLSLKNLTDYLYRHHGTKPWVLIDEYDTPLQSAYVENYFDEMLSLMRSLFGNVLKDNPYLHKAVVTGILRIAKENLFSGLNNLKVHTVLQNQYSQYFGFTENEVKELINQSGLEQYSKEIRDWYNGYLMGETLIYNPWSVVNCIHEHGKLSPYWINTSDNQLIRNLLSQSSQAFKEQFEILLQGKTIKRLINDQMVFSDLKKNETAAWSLLLMAGYLKVSRHELIDAATWCDLQIPNREVQSLYRQIIEEWLANGFGIEWYLKFLNHLLSGDMEKFSHDLKKIMEESVSVHDTGRDAEAFYHGLFVGLTATLHNNKNYELSSNREGGYGRYDYMILSHDKNKLTLLMEFKKIEAVKNEDELANKLEKAAQEALQQIIKQEYFKEATKRGITNILKIGLAFCGKRFKLCFEK